MKKWLNRQRDIYKRRKARKDAIKQQTKHIHTLTLREVIAQYIQSKIKPRARKQSVIDPNAEIMPTGHVNHIAIVLDGRVEDVIRAQNRMTALLLSEPQFVAFDPKEVYPVLGVTEYKDGQFINAREMRQSNVAEDLSLANFNLDDYLKEQDKK